MASTKSHQTTRTRHQLAYIPDFQFNEASSLLELWKVYLSVNQPAVDFLELRIPAFIPKEKIAAPAWPNRVECMIVAASCSLHDSLTNGSNTHAFNIPYNEAPVAAQNIRLLWPCRLVRWWC